MSEGRRVPLAVVGRDARTIRSAAATAPSGRVEVLPGVYTDEVISGLEDVPATDVEVAGVGPEHEQVIDARISAGMKHEPQLPQIMYSARVSGLTVLAQNIRHTLHVEAGNRPNHAAQTFEDITLINSGAERDGWATCVGFGIGLHEGNRQIYNRVTAISRDSPTGGLAFGFHNNADWQTSAEVEANDCRFIAPDPSGYAISCASHGAGIVSRAVFRNCLIDGHVHLNVGAWLSARPETHRTNRFEFKLHFDGCTPFDWHGLCPTVCLELRSQAGPASSVSVSGAGAKLLFGVPFTKPGGAGYAARLYSQFAVAPVEGDIGQPELSLASRLGDLRHEPLELVIGIDGRSVALELGEDFTQWADDQVVAFLNHHVGSEAFRLSQGVFDNRAPLFQNQREAYGRNVAETAILKGHALVYEGRQVRHMTASDDVDLFAGIALDEAMPGEPARFQRSGLINGQHIWRALGISYPALGLRDRFEVGPEQGVLVPGSTRPVLRVQGCEHMGGTLALLTSCP